MKKIISTILAGLVAFSQLGVYASYTDVPSSSDFYESSIRLQDLGIISGYEDGSFHPENNITRAEFTKIVICMMDKEKEAAASTSSPGFYDVPQGSWAAPYINYAVSQDILSGYSDGSFAPYKTISFAEALTILLRTLGYSEADVGYYWPNNYVSAAGSIGLTDGMFYETGTPLNRADAAKLIDRALFTKPASSKNADTYIESLGYTLLDDVLVLDRDTDNNNVSILSGNLKLSNMSTYISKTGFEIYEGDTFENAVINKKGEFATIRSYTNSKDIASETVIVTRLSGNTIEYTNPDGEKGIYRADDTLVTYYENNKMTFASSKNYISNGVDITFYGSNAGTWSIAVIGTDNDVDPVLARRSYSSDDTSFEGIPINHSRLIVYRDGEAATLSDIEINDVVYYNTKTNIMDVYSEKVTGVYYSAYPSKAYAEKVTVGGNTYELGYSAAINKLDASDGAFDIGERVTLLLGKDGKAVFCVDNASGFDYYSYGVLLSNIKRTSSEGENKGITETVAQLFMPDGQVHEIVTDTQYKENIGDLMHITYSGGKASLSPVNNKNISDYAGTINKNERTINGKYLLQDAAIIQLNSDMHATVAECELLDFENLTADSIGSGSILNVVSANKFGDIAIIFVKSLENTYDYGVIGGFVKSDNPISGSTTTNGYKIFSDSTLSSYMLGSTGKITTSLGSAVGYKLANGQLSKLVALESVASSEKLEAIEGGRIMISGKIYKLSPDVQIVDISNTSNMRTITIDELDSMETSSVVLYSDKAKSADGIIRVITVKS